VKIAIEISGKPEFPWNYLGPDNPHRSTLLLREHILAMLAEFHPLGARGIGYQVINRFTGYGDKSDAFMERVAEQIKFMRLRGLIPFAHVIDESREIRTDTFWKNAVQIVNAAKRGFKLDPWPDQPFAVLVVAEKHGLAGILEQVTRPLRLPLATLGGTCSHTFAHDLAMWIASRPDQQVRILYLGDYDPSGVHIPVWLWREICGTARADGLSLDHFYRDVRIERLAIKSVAQAQSYGAVLRRLSDEKSNCQMLWIGR
jgi:hypothetical protein